MRRIRTLVLVVLVVSLAVVLFVACGGAGVKTSHSSSTTSSSQAPKGWQSLNGVVATAPGPLNVYASTDATTVAAQLPAQTHFGSPTTLLALAWKGEGSDWLKVALPTRPNGATGFVHGNDVVLGQAGSYLDVDLGARRLRVGDMNGNVLVETAIAVGSRQNPTPTGSFFVTDVIDTTNDGGAYGPFALGLSAHSNTLSEFDGGDGEIGIHGTNQPSSIGNAVSHGCVRVPNDVIDRLAHMLVLGTPVTIR